ncbi:MAG: hypothetical protein JRE82_08995 [Deltaproteobacteria bacterium]|nr:hypothetical protein [Deltaproteobacteria bacterium]
MTPDPVAVGGVVEHHGEVAHRQILRPEPVALLPRKIAQHPPDRIDVDIVQQAVVAHEPGVVVQDETIGGGARV